MTSNTTQLSVRTDRVRFVFLISPTDGMSDERFKRYWLENHGPLFTSLAIVKKNILKYEQFHIEPSYTELFAAAEPSFTPLPYRGMAIFEAENMQKLAEVFQDEEYFRLVRPDEQKFIKMTSAKPVAGSVATFIDN